MIQPPRGDTPHDEIARDEYLLAALRHAPDADLEPSPVVSAYILAQAYAATKRRAAPGAAARPWRTWLQGLPAPRAPWAAAFGTIAAATLVGVMWSSVRMPADPAPVPTGDTAAPPQKAAPAAAAPVPATAAREAKIEPAPASQRRPTEPPAAAAAAERGKAESGPAERRKSVASSAQGAATDSANVAAVASPPPVAPTAVAPRIVLPTPAPSATPAAPPAAVAEALRKPAAEAAAPDAAAAAKGTVSAPSVVNDLRAQSAEQQLAAAGAAAQRDTTIARAAAGRADPSMRIDAVLRSATLDAATWRHAERTYAHGGEQRLWWSQVGDATQGRWQAVQDGRGDAAEPWIVLSISGSRVAAFWFAGDALWLRDAIGLWRVQVTAAQRRSWQTAADHW